MEPFVSFTGDVRAGAWLANIHTLHDTDDERVRVALENIADPAKKVLDEIARAVEAKQFKLWFWTWDTLQMAMLYVESKSNARSHSLSLLTKFVLTKEEELRISNESMNVTVGCDLSVC